MIYQNEKLVDISKLREIKIEKRKANKIGQAVLNTVVYGGEIGLLLGYEELIAMAKNKKADAKTLGEKADAVYTDNQTGRRSFFKIAASFLGAFSAYAFGKDEDKELKDRETEAEKSIDSAFDLVNLDNDNAFKEYFGLYPKELIDSVKNKIETSKITLRNNVKSEKVRTAFENLVVNGEKYNGFLEKNFDGGVRDDLGEVIKSSLVRKSFDSVSSIQATKANTEVLIEGLIVGGAMAAVILPLEIRSHFEK